MSPAAVSRVTRIRAWERDPLVRVVEIEGAGTFRLDAATVDALALGEGAEIDGRLVRRVAEAAVRQQGRVIALRLLQRRLRSRAEVEAGLRRRGVLRVALAGVVSDLERAGWIDDARFARAWVRDRLALRPSGRRRLKAELVSRGVSPQIADNAISASLTEEGEEELALVQARARLRRMQRLSPPVARRRLAGWLQRRGFGPEAIARVMRTVQGATVDEEEEDAHASA